MAGPARPGSTGSGSARARGRARGRAFPSPAAAIRARCCPFSRPPFVPAYHALTMRLTFYGAARTVTGSKYLLDTGSKRILIDCGLFQGEAKDEEHWNTLPFDPNEIDVAIITHGHLDHVGLLPLIVKDGVWKGRVLSTPATRDVSGFILRDSAKQIGRAHV